MKPTSLFLTLLLALTLSACGAPQPTPSATTGPMIELPSPATEPSGEGELSQPLIEPAYLELLTACSIALSEKWDAGTLMENGFDPLLADCYGDAPLENIGYAITDLDGDGIEELAIGTTDRVTDAFYGKLILALYTRDADDTMLPVFRSAERDRYYYAGGNSFAHLGSSGAADSVETTEEFKNGSMNDIGSVTNVENYVQLELTPMGQWAQMIGFPGLPQTTALELPILEEIAQSVTTGTAGSYLTAAVKLLDWGINTGLDPEEIREATAAWLAGKGNDAQVAFAEKLALVDEAYQKLLTDDAEKLLASAGLEGTERFWPDSPVEPVEAIMDAAGLR